jgi:hypothetical protein
MRSPIQEAILVALAAILRPLVKLMLQAGLGCSEFVEVSKSVFVKVASDEYGLRGRPTNMSRVSAMTGISRKEVSRIRKGGFPGRWTPDKETSPASTVLHYWHYDPDFADATGQPRDLPFDGPGSFSTLVSRYAGDIPPGAMRAELRRDGAVDETPEGLLAVRARWFRPTYFDEDFVRRIAFSLQNLGATIVHNAGMYQRPEFTKRSAAELGRFERLAWSERLDDEKIQLFKTWVQLEGARFIENADHWIGTNELAVDSWTAEGRAVGVGIYFFEEDQQ